MEFCHYGGSNDHFFAQCSMSILAVVMGRNGASIRAASLSKMKPDTPESNWSASSSSFGIAMYFENMGTVTSSSTDAGFKSVSRILRQLDIELRFLALNEMSLENTLWRHLHRTRSSYGYIIPTNYRSIS